MYNESCDPFNFEIPEKKVKSIWIKVLSIFLTGIFITTTLAKIDSSTFNYNKATYTYKFQECSELKCLLITCQ